MEEFIILKNKIQKAVEQVDSNNESIKQRLDTFCTE